MTYLKTIRWIFFNLFDVNSYCVNRSCGKRDIVEKLKIVSIIQCNKYLYILGKSYLLSFSRDQSTDSCYCCTRMNIVFFSAS